MEAGIDGGIDGSVKGKDRRPLSIPRARLSHDGEPGRAAGLVRPPFLTVMIWRGPPCRDDAMNRNILIILLIAAALIAGALVWYPLW
jgi:hypothetical protein